MRPLCDDCEMQWRRDKKTPDGHLRRTIIDYAQAKGREIDVDAEVTRITGGVADKQRRLSNPQKPHAVR